MKIDKRLIGIGVVAVLAVVIYCTTFVQAAPKVTEAPFGGGVITANELNVRSGPGTEYDVVRLLKNGDKVTLLGKADTWYVVYCDDGKVGFSLGQYIKDDGSNLPALPLKTAQPSVQPSTSPSATDKPTTPPGPTVKMSAEQSEFLSLINAERKGAGLAELKADSKLMKVADLKAQDMVVNNYFSHQSPTHGSPFDMMKLNGVTYKIAGENISGNPSISGAVKTWMNSKGHKENILNSKYNYTGIGVVDSPKYGKILVQMFIQK